MATKSRLNANAREYRPLPFIKGELRSLFLTFSNGLPLSEVQITTFFNQMYGQCVQTVQIHRPQRGYRARKNPPLFGKVIFSDMRIPLMVMSGEEYVDFIVEGRPLRCKKYDIERRKIVVK